MAVNATTIWRVRPSGSNSNGGGYDPGISGAATDYSRQNAAQATGTHGTATGTTTFTDTVAANFTSAMVGNALWIASGTGFTVGAYFIVTFNSATSVVLDRSPGTGTVAVWALGGGWADPSANCQSATTPVVAGNTVFVLGSGTPNPAAYTYDYTITTSITVQGAGTSFITFANDPSTPGYKAPPDTTGGMPVIKNNVASGGMIASNPSFLNFKGLYFVRGASADTGSTGGIYNSAGGSGYSWVQGCVFDQFGLAGIMINTSNGGSVHLFGCEGFSSVASTVAGAFFVDAFNAGACMFVGNNFHDTLNPTLRVADSCIVINNIIAKSLGIGVSLGYNNSPKVALVTGNTIDGNGANGISISSPSGTQSGLFSFIFNNIISNQTGVGAFGIAVDNGSAAANTAVVLADWNVFYNNTADLSNLSYGPHDTFGGSNPYVGQATENYTLA